MRLFQFIAAMVVLVTCSSEANAQPNVQSEDLEGIWAAEIETSRVLKGPLTLTREGSVWRAQLAGMEQKFDANANAIRFAFPGGAGFRGTLAPDGRSITGYWINPTAATDAQPDQPGSMQAFATPMTLARTAANAWRGEVRPLERRFHLYLRIFRRDEDGVLIGALRNPELNAIGGASRFRVTRDGNNIRFRERYDDNSPEFGPDAVLLSDPARLRIKWPELDREVELVRRAPEEVPDFFSRPPGSAPYVYARPPETGDDWRTARASETGIDEAVLTRVVQGIASTDPTVRRPSLIHSILVAHRGRLVLEEYFFGYGRDIPHDTRSAGKTFASVLLGTAMHEGVALTPKTRVYPLLAGMGPFQNLDPRKQEITLTHLMTHTTGLACDDNAENPVSPGNEDVMQRNRAQPNWWKVTLDLPMVHNPGVRYAYCSMTMSLMGAALTTATRTWLPEYFDRAVARPLQFGEWHWNLLPKDEGYLGGGAWIRPRDLLKVGQTYLDGGVWRGRRIVDASWVAESTRPHVRISPATTGLTAEQFGNSYSEADEALAWHLTEIRAGEAAHRGYLAAGNGGQVILVIPDFDLVAVFTGGNHRQGGIWSQWGNTIIGAQIIPAIKR